MASQRIFVSYRRSDSGLVVERIFDVFATLFGRSNVFRDVESIDAGIPFDVAVTSAIRRCHVFLLVIGVSWSDARSDDGERRLDRHDDPVRLEIETALAHQIPIMPVLVGGATMPDARDIPDTLRRLSFTNAFVIGDETFHGDLSRLCSALKDHDPAGFARKLAPAWPEDLVAPAESLAQLWLAVKEVRLKQQLSEQWGLDWQDAREGTRLALHGPQGCGKTVAARVFARILGMDLYQIDLEEAILRWNVGDRIPLDWLLRRTVEEPVVLQVRDTLGALSSAAGGAKEARLVASSLLRRLDERDGVVIVTSRGTLAEGSTGGFRFDHVIEIPFPDQEARQQIWRRAIPNAMPRAPDVDFEALAGLAISGLSIRQAVQRAALVAADAGEYVSMSHLESAARRASLT